MKRIKLQELKAKTAAELIDFAKENGVENSSSLAKTRITICYTKTVSRSGC